MGIDTYSFKESEIENLKTHPSYSNWPVVYLLNDMKRVYIGETVNIHRRIKEHHQDGVRKTLKKINIIYDEQFNKSATLNIETKLIEYMSADKNFKIMNGNGGQRKHDFYEKKKYEDMFDGIWSELRDKQIVKNDLRDIENSDLFKYSPYKTLSDEQYSIVDDIVQQLDISNDNPYFRSKQIINGEPGSGKTIIAVYLVKYLLGLEKYKDARIGLVIPQSSLRKTIEKVFRSVEGLSAKMILSPYGVVRDAKGKQKGGFNYDVLIVDEAHRLTRRKGLSNYKTYDKVNEAIGYEKEATQLDWVLQASQNIILMYDEKQSIKPSDMLSGRLKNFATQAYAHHLKSQFRVTAGSGYTKYIEDLLTQRLHRKEEFASYDLLLFDDVDVMVERIKALDTEHGLCRNVAGYAWKWHSKNDSSKKDIFIDGHGYQWNSVAKDWVNSENALEEIGCVHTVQGYDLNYCGVIIGPELIYRDGKIQYVSKEFKDISSKDSKLTSDEMKGYIVNIYKILMTRGMKGTFIYVCDDELRGYVKGFVEVFCG